jgi:hypothetical protein
MAKKKKFTVRVAYKVYDYYDVEATSEERAIEKALEQSSEDSLNDFIQEGGECIVTQINSKPVEPKKPEPEKLMVLCSYDSDEQEFDDHLIVSKKVFYSTDGKKQIRKYLNEAFEYENMDNDDREEFRECVKNLLKGGVGYFGIKYFWEETTAIL